MSIPDRGKRLTICVTILTKLPALQRRSGRNGRHVKKNPYLNSKYLDRFPDITKRVLDG